MIASLALARPAATQSSPPSRDLSQALAAVPGLAGTQGGERAAQLVSRTLEQAGSTVELDFRGHAARDGRETPRALAAMAHDAVEERSLDRSQGERLAGTYERLAGPEAGGLSRVRVYQALSSPLPDRPRFNNPFRAPGLGKGHTPETWPTLRATEGGADCALARPIKAAERLGS